MILYSSTACICRDKGRETQWLPRVPKQTSLNELFPWQANSRTGQLAKGLKIYLHLDTKNIHRLLFVYSQAAT